MTSPQARRLVQRQAKVFSEKSLAMLDKSKIKLNPLLARELILSSKDLAVLKRIEKIFLNRISKKDINVLRFLMKHALEESNSNSTSRCVIFEILSKVVNPTTKEVNSVFNQGARDSSGSVRILVGFTLRDLAKKGVREVIPGLTQGVNDKTSATIRDTSLDGLNELAKQGVFETYQGLKNGFYDKQQGHVTKAIIGIEFLAKQGHKQAKELLEEFEGHLEG